MRKEILTTSVIASAASLEGAMITVAIPQIASQLHISKIDSTAFLTLYALISSLLFVPFYLIAERKGVKKLLFLGSLIFSSSGIAILFVNSFLPALILRSLQAVGSSMIYPAQLAYATSFKGDEGKNLGFNYSMLALAYILGAVLGYFIGLADWRLLFLLPSVIVLASLFFMPGLKELKGSFGSPRSVIGPTLVFNGALLSPYSFYVGLPLFLAGLYSLMRWPLKREFLKPLFSGFFHSISRYVVVEYLVLSYAGLFQVNPLYALLLIILFPAPMLLLSAPLGRALGDRDKAFAIAGFSLMLFSWLFPFNKVLATIVLGIGTAIGTVSNTAYTMKNLRVEERVVGSAIKTLEGVVGISLGPAIAVALFHFSFGVELAIFILNLLAILLLIL